MNLSFPVIVCFVGAIVCFWTTFQLRRFNVRDLPPSSLAHLSREERQQKIRIASWICFAMGCLMLIGAITIGRLQFLHLRSLVIVALLRAVGMRI